jgi:hypothetical protein
MTTSTELLLNMKRIPDKSSREYDAFWDNERHKAEYGVTINGVFISGWLYWHTQLWNIYIDVEDSINHTIKRTFKHPEFRDNEWIIDEGLQEANKDKKGVMFFGSRRLGKDLLNSSKLYFNGYEGTIGDAKIGDIIYGDDGKLTTITAVFPQGVRPVYKITLLDGREIFCGLDHNHLVYTKDGKKCIKTTKELLVDYKHKRIHNGYKDKITRTLYETMYSIPTAKAVEYSKNNISIDPYFLGLWLGDGISANTGISNIDGEIIDFIHQYAKDLKLQVSKYKENYYITSGIKGADLTRNTLLNNLKGYNLLNNKHIPNDYLYNDYDTRMAILQGLMDSDGYVSKGGSISISSSIPQLANDITKLIRSLGITCSVKQKQAKLYGVNKKIAYIITLYTDKPVFRLSRKLNNLYPISKNRKPKIDKTSIIDIQYVFDAETTCITVDNESHCFLTDNYTITHNSELSASYIGRHATLFQGSENVIAASNWGDIDVITYKITQGLNAIPDYFKFGRLSENLRKEIELGFKDKKGTRLSWSKIIARNHEEGLNTEAIAGITASSFVMDEIGKSQFAQVFEAAKPAFTSPYGWRCSPILTGTAGDIKKSSDAEKFFMNPEAYNFIARELIDEGNIKTGVFISGLRRMEGKYKTTLADYVSTEKGILVPKDSELNTVEFYNSNFAKAEAVIDEERLQASKSPDPMALLKATMYYPKNTKELFLVEDGNNFPVEAIMEHIAYLQANEELQGTPVKLYRDSNNKVKVSFNTNKKPILDYPLKFDDKVGRDAPVVIYELPMDDSPTYINISGADPYNQSSSKWSSSLGSVYVYKRMYDPIGGTFQRRIVASYTARPDTLKEWHENVELLLEFYNAVCMPENEAGTFIQYFDSKNKGHYLADGYNFLKEISPSTSITGRVKGLPATTKVQQYYKELVYQYCMEEVVVGTDKEGALIKKLGVVRIPDIGLLRELAAYTDKGNFDRYVAFGHTLAHEVWADKMYPYIEPPKNKQEETRQAPKIFNPFGGIKKGSPFIIKR